jgi:tripartite-type tricarboxylate transporter receptor subunit TctC
VHRFFAALTTALIAFAAPVLAQEWPAKQVTIIVPFTAGGTTDMFARILAQGLQQKYPGPFIVENRAGAGGNIGAAAVARAPKDGYTLLVGTVSTHAINPFIYKNLAHDTEKDFQPVSLIARLPNMLVVNPKVPAKTVAELVDYPKNNPDKFNYGSSGVGTSTHLAAELFQIRTGTKMTHVPFRSSNEVMTALIGGHIDLAFDNITLAWPQAQAGKVHALGVTSTTPSATAPEVPPVAASIAGFDATSWHGLFAPAGTPQPVIDRLYKAVRFALDDPDTQKKLEKSGFSLVGSTPAELDARVKRDLVYWRNTIRDAGIEPK